MDRTINVLNELLVDVFNEIMTIEQTALHSGKFRDLSVTEVHSIQAIGMYHPKTMSEVASTLQITVGTFTVAVNNLVRKGYVERKRSKQDRRVVEIQLTHKGRLAYRIHEKFHSDMIREIIEDLEPDENEVLVKTLEKLNKFFKERYSLKNCCKKE